MSPFSYRPAVRQGLPLVIGVVGGTGGGKTMSALRLAKGMAGGKRFALLDSEAGRALHYADQFDFDHAVLESPFRPAAYTEAIKGAEDADYPVLVVDSMSHVWAGPGGVLEWHDDLMDGKEAKKMTAWIKPKGEHRKMVDAITQMKRMHLVLAFRAQQKVEMVKVNGKWEVIPKQSLTGLDGWVPICESQLPFELTMSLLLTADAPGVPHPIKLEAQHRPLVPLDSPLTEQTGAALARWAAGTTGTDPEIVAHAKQLEDTILSLTGDDEKRAAARDVIARQRVRHEGDPGAFIAWLGAQLEKKRADAMNREQVSLEL